MIEALSLAKKGIVTVLPSSRKNQLLSAIMGEPIRGTVIK